MSRLLAVNIVVAAGLLLGVATVRALDNDAAGPPPGQASSGLVDGGIEGQVSIGPGCPGPVGADPDCGARLAGLTISVLDEQGRVACQVQPDIDGRFRVTLPAGTYTVRPERGPWINAPERTVTVADGQIAPVRIAYRSGIR
jgi:hypothetical protein